MTEPAHAEALAARLVSGQVDEDVLRWLQRGVGAWHRSGGVLSLERCLRLTATPFQRRVRQRNGWLAELARQVDAEPGEGPLAHRVHRALDRFQTRGLWANWKDAAAPPAGAAQLHAAAFWVLKFNAGKALSFWHIRDLLQGEIRPEISHGAEGNMDPVTPTPTSEN
jgi:hypothetical protein